MDFLEKNKVVLSLVPLKKAMVDETASVRESFKIQRNFKSTDKFFKPVLSIDGASTVSINSLAEIALEEQLKIDEPTSPVQNDSGSVQSELSQRQFVEEIVDLQTYRDLRRKKIEEEEESSDSGTILERKKSQAATLEAENLPVANLPNEENL